MALCNRTYEVLAVVNNAICQQGLTKIADKVKVGDDTAGLAVQIIGSFACDIQQARDSLGAALFHVAGSHLEQLESNIGACMSAFIRRNRGVFTCSWKKQYAPPLGTDARAGAPGAADLEGYGDLRRSGTGADRLRGS